MAMNRYKKQLLRVGIALVLVVMVLIISIYLMLTYRPASYQPHPLSQFQAEQVEQSCWKKSQQFYNHIHLMEPFEFDLEERLLNQFLMLEVTQEFLGNSGSGVARYLQLPQVHFCRGRIHLMGQIIYHGITAVLTVTLEPKMSQPNRLQIALRAVKIGAMPIWVGLIENQFEQIGEKLAYKKKTPRKDKTTKHKDSYHKCLYNDVLPDIIEFCYTKELTVNTVFRATEDKHKLCQIKQIRIFNGHIELALEPIWQENYD